VVCSGIRGDDEAGLSLELKDVGKYLFERTRVVIRECTGGESASGRGSANMCGKLQDRSLSIRSCADNGDICGILDGCNDAGREDDFLPGFADVDDMDTVWAALPYVRLHVGLQSDTLSRIEILRSFWSQCDIEQPKALSCPRQSLRISEKRSWNTGERETYHGTWRAVDLWWRWP